MPVASLSNFTVPLASNQSASSQGLLMPKLKFRFRASFVNFGISTPTTELTKQVIDIKRPNINFNPQTIDVYNSKVYFQGKPEWQETTINLRDDVSGGVSKLVGEQVQKQFDFLEQASAPSGTDYKFQLVYEVLDGGNGTTTVNVLEAWELDGCFLSSVDWGDMSYGSNDPTTISLTIKFDNAVQTYGGAVGRLNTGAAQSPTFQPNPQSGTVTG
jgi:hypothetical protein